MTSEAAQAEVALYLLDCERFGLPPSARMAVKMIFCRNAADKALVTAAYRELTGAAAEPEETEEQETHEAQQFF